MSSFDLIVFTAASALAGFALFKGRRLAAFILCAALLIAVAIWAGLGYFLLSWWPPVDERALSAFLKLRLALAVMVIGGIAAGWCIRIAIISDVSPKWKLASSFAAAACLSVVCLLLTTATMATRYLDDARAEYLRPVDEVEWKRCGAIAEWERDRGCVQEARAHYVRLAAARGEAAADIYRDDATYAAMIATARQARKAGFPDQLVPMTWGGRTEPPPVTFREILVGHRLSAEPPTAAP